MPRQPSSVPLSLPALDTASPTPLHRQVYIALRESILSGRLGPGARLPSTRDLAQELCLSRNTVVSAYDHLAAEGFLDGRTGAGTYVAHSLPGDLIRARRRRGDDRQLGSSVPTLSRRGELLAGTVLRDGYPDARVRPFRAGVPAVDEFPYESWARLGSRLWRRMPSDLMGYGDPAGYPPLRRAIAEYLTVSRGVRCTAEQVIIVAGTQQALDLVARLALDPDDVAWVEEPGYAGVRGALLGAGVTVVPVPVDTEGLDVAAGERLAHAARLVSVTPSHQYPVGVTMTLPRRLALLEWAARAGAWILEDDYDAEFRYSGKPYEALQGLDTNGRVIYLGTFSKVLAPALRLGYLVAPPALVDAVTNARAVATRHPPTIDQAVLAEFIAEGAFARHIRRMRSRYAERQAALLSAAHETLDGLLDVRPADAGMHVVGWLPPSIDGALAARLAAAHGVDVYPFATSGEGSFPEREGLMLGYAPFDEVSIRSAVRSLGKALARTRR